MLRLVIGSKNYSSWSLRPWLALAHHKIPFDEILIPIDQPDTAARIRQYSPAGKVPILIDGEAAVWESIAILEHLNERFPQLQLWPKDPVARAHARAVATEMHAGFTALRQHCPMNLRRKKARPLTPEVEADVQRITGMWRTARERFGTGGDFLFGGFSAADCMYAPVAARFASYEVEVDPVSKAYVDAIYRLPAFAAWREAALKETWGHRATDAVA
ncbi:MAG: glutathione S-transferase family protein [Bradyrhizobiaceae bacterium]|nr:glutathione S-transferase family protein [Bradyrhizobiaceae bacterium]